MLEIRPNCECCDKDLPNESPEARICSFECTFCSTCAIDKLDGTCPNCGGELVVRPRRPKDKLSKYPASSKRVLKPLGCDMGAHETPRRSQGESRRAQLGDVAL